MSNLNIGVGMRAYIMSKYNSGRSKLWKPKNAKNELIIRDFSKWRYKKKAYTLNTHQEIQKINEALKGKSYPYLMAAGSVLVGIGTAGAGTVIAAGASGAWSAVSAYSDDQQQSSKHQEIRARINDEIWVYEMIKKNGKSYQGILAFYLRDPYRKEKFGVKIHRESHELSKI